MSQDVCGHSTGDRDRYDEEGNIRRVGLLRARGVEVWGSDRVYIGPDVPLEQIASGAVLKSASITGSSTSVGKGAVVGNSGMAVVHDCQFGEYVQVGAGLFEGATLLDGSKARGFAELRPNTLLEEEAEIAHNTGLKNTVFTIAVVAGSGVNFCDVFVSGGSSRREHTEIGSGAVHFNYDPRADKFGSLFGDARGVLLRSPRIFIGGNSGIVAPLHVDFGALIPAGCTIRRQIPPSETYGPQTEQPRANFSSELYLDLRRKFINTARLIGNLHSLALWYRTVRIPFAPTSERPLYQAAIHRIEAQIAHRITELAKVIRKLETSVSKGPQNNPFFPQHERIVRDGGRIQQWLASPDYPAPPTPLVDEYATLRGRYNHCGAVRALSDQTCQPANSWLMQIPSQLITRFQTLFA